MAEFKKPFRSGNSRPSFSRGGGASRGGFSPRSSFEKKEMFDAECSNCHKATQVPFRPNGKKPVFCRDCFTPDTGSERSSAPRFERRPFPTAERSAPARVEKDPRIDDILHRLDSIERSLEKLSGLLSAATRKEALGEEVRKHLPTEDVAPKRKKATKKSVAA